MKAPTNTAPSWKRRTFELFVFTIFSGTRLWGFIGYDDCTTERIWTDSEIATLQTVAGGIGIVFRRHELEQALREKNSKYELALRGSQHGIWELDLVTGKTFVSRQWRDLFGFHNLGDDSLDYELYLTLVHPDDREKLTREIEAYLKKVMESRHHLSRPAFVWRIPLGCQ